MIKKTTIFFHLHFLTGHLRELLRIFSSSIESATYKIRVGYDDQTAIDKMEKRIRGMIYRLPKELDTDLMWWFKHARSVGDINAAIHYDKAALKPYRSDWVATTGTREDPLKAPRDAVNAILGILDGLKDAAQKRASGYGMSQELDELLDRLKTFRKKVQQVVSVPTFRKLNGKIATARNAAKDESMNLKIARQILAEGTPMTIRTPIPDSQLNTTELIQRIKSYNIRGGVQTNWGHFVKARALNPEISKPEFNRIWDAVGPNPYIQTRQVDFVPTHKSKNVPGLTMMVTQMKPTHVSFITSYGGPGGEPMQFFDMSWEPI